jgi:hypothetical protein
VAGGFVAGVEVELLKNPAGLGVSVVGFPKLKPAEAAGLVAGLVVVELGVPKRPELPCVEPKMDGFAGAGVDAGVVESCLTCSAGLGSSSVVSISVSFETGVCATGALAALSRALPKLPPKNELLDPPGGPGSSSLAELSALNVDTRLKGLEPKRFVGLSPFLFGELVAGADPPNTELVVGAEPPLDGPKVGLDPKILPVEVGAAAVKPPFDANAENPPEVGATEVEVLAALEPNTEVGFPSPDG